MCSPAGRYAVIRLDLIGLLSRKCFIAIIDGVAVISGAMMGGWMGGETYWR